MVEIIGVEHIQGSRAHARLVEDFFHYRGKAVVGLELSPVELDTIKLLRTLHRFEEARRGLAGAERSEGRPRDEAVEQYRREREAHGEEARQLIASLRGYRGAKLSFGARYRPPTPVRRVAEEAAARLESPKARAPTLRTLDDLLSRHYFANVAHSLLDAGHEVVGVESHVRKMEADRRFRRATGKSGEPTPGILETPGLYKAFAFDRSKAMAHAVAAEPRLTHVIVGADHARHLREHFLATVKRGHREVAFSERRVER